MKKLFSFLLIIITATTIFAQSQRKGSARLSTLQKKINKILSDHFFTSSQIGIDVFDLNTRRTIYHKNEKLLFRPASNLKILTSAAGLLFLGPDYEFTTKLFQTGNIKGSTLFGDLYIQGGFDPLFSTDDIDTNRREKY